MDVASSDVPVQAGAGTEGAGGGWNDDEHPREGTALGVSRFFVFFAARFRGGSSKEAGTRAEVLKGVVVAASKPEKVLCGQVASSNRALRYSVG